MAATYEPVQDTITLNSGLTSASVGKTYTINTAVGANLSNAIYTVGTTSATAPWGTTTASTRIQLAGENADIEVNGWSLVQAVKRIEQRLGLFQPNPKLEAEWDQLRELGEQYRQLEAQLTEQTEMWNQLKKMPPPDPLT